MKKLKKILVLSSSEKVMFKIYSNFNVLHEMTFPKLCE